MSLSPGTPIGKYVVRRKLAEGGMAEIYLCHVLGPEGFQKEVVIKRIRAFLATDSSFVQMFIAEARVASRLNHPNVVQIFDFDKHEDTYYLAMEYVHGHSLWDVRKRAKERMEPMPPTLVAHICAAVARGLHYAHRVSDKGRPLGLVHRDVTPHNVLLSYDGAIKLTDFGIAKAGNKLTSPGMLKGKFAYMSPEQARGDEVDARTDLFALGIVLWEMLTGGRLFDGDSDVAVLRAVQQSVIASPARLNPDVPADLDAIVMRALQRDPAARFQTAQEMERALTQVVMAHARRLEDTDVGHYLAQLFAEEVATLSEHSVVSKSSPGGDAAAPVKEPTAVMRPSSGSGRSAPSGVVTAGNGILAADDEDAHGSTHVVDRSASSAPRVATAVAPGSRPPLPVSPAIATAAAGDGPAPDLLKTLDGTPPPGAVPSTLLPVELVPKAPPVAPPQTTAPLSREDVSVMRRSLGTRRGVIVGTMGVLALGIVGVGVWKMRGTPEPSAAAVPSPSADPLATPAADAGDPTIAAVAPPFPSGSTPSTTEVTREVAVVSGAETVPDPGVPVETTQAIGDEAEAPAPVRHASRSREGQGRSRFGTGTLNIKVSPWAQVIIDGKSYGELMGARTFKLPAGRHVVRFVHDKSKHTETIFLQAGEERTLEHRPLAE